MSDECRKECSDELGGLPNNQSQTKPGALPKQGFICPCCKYDIGSMSKLHTHYGLCCVLPSKFRRGVTVQRNELSMWEQASLAWRLGVAEVTEAANSAVGLES